MVDAIIWWAVNSSLLQLCAVYLLFILVVIGTYKSGNKNKKQKKYLHKSRENK